MGIQEEKFWECRNHNWNSIVAIIYVYYHENPYHWESVGEMVKYEWMEDLDFPYLILQATSYIDEQGPLNFNAPFYLMVLKKLDRWNMRQYRQRIHRRRLRRRYSILKKKFEQYKKEAIIQLFLSSKSQDDHL